MVEISESQFELMKRVREKGHHGGKDKEVYQLMVMGLVEQVGFCWRLTEMGENILQAKEEMKDDGKR